MENAVQSILWSWRSIRFRVAVMLAAALCIEGLMRSNLNMAMVCMVNRTAILQIEQVTVSTPKPQELVLDNSQGFSPTDSTEDNVPLSCRGISSRGARSYHGDLVWTAKEQAWIFAAFYVGGLSSVIPGSFLCDWLGATVTVQLGAVLNVIGSLTTPFTAYNIGIFGMIFVRFWMGCGQGVLVPCMSVLITHWFPREEKSTAVAIATTGNQLSIIFAMVVTAKLCQVPFLNGWPTAFYLYGIIGVALCFCWFLLVNDVPTRAHNISDSELTYITGTALVRGQKRTTPTNVPWGKILTSAVVWSTAASSFCQSFVIVGTVTYLPLYYRTVLNMDLTLNGLLSALPFFIQLLAKLVFAGIADKAKEVGYSPTNVTKTCNLIASFGGAACFIALMFLDCNHKALSVIFVCLSMGIMSGYIPGYNTSIVCIAPKYTSSVASFCRLWATIASVLSPYFIGIITVKSDLSEWRLVFVMKIIILVSTGIFFQFFGEASEQKWAKDTVNIPLSKEPLREN